MPDGKTTLRLSLRASFRVYVFVVLLVAMALFDRYYTPAARPTPHHRLALVLDAILAWLTAQTLLKWWFERLVADETGFESFNFANRRGSRIEFGALTAYRPTRIGTWVLFAGEKRVRTADVEPADFHRLIVQRAPKALKARKLRSGMLPPSEDFARLWLFDWYELFSSVLGASIISLPICLIAPEFGAIYFAITLVSQGYRLLDLGGRLSVDGSGLRVRWPWQTREILWPEATAIFCEKTGRERRFVVTSAETSITIPRHIALDLEVMRKVLHSLPSGTLCVGFDDSIRRGWRRGRRRRVPGSVSASPGLEPAFGAGF